MVRQVYLEKILDLFDKWFKHDFLEIEKCINWHFIYSKSNPPTFLVNEAQIEIFKNQIKILRHRRTNQYFGKRYSAS